MPSAMPSSTPSARRASWKLLSAFWLLSLVPVIGGAARLINLASGSAATPDTLRFVAMPVPVVLHVVGATVFCLLGALQFDAAIRRRSPRLHRACGRLVAICGVVAALTGLWMTVAYPIPAALQGDLLLAVRLVVGLAMSLALVVAVRAVLRGRLIRHRAWMLRAYALGQGAGTQVLILLPVSLVLGPPTHLLRDVLMTSAWVLNVVLAEVIIHRQGSTRPAGAGAGAGASSRQRPAAGDASPPPALVD
jgi:uncharacterized membrane protein